MKKSSILYLGNFSSKNFAAFNRAMGVSKLFFQCDFAVHATFYDDLSKLNSESFIKQNDIVLHCLQFSKKQFYTSAKEQISLINQIGNVSVVVLYNYPAIPSLSIIKYCRKKGIIVISDVSEWYDTSNIPLFMKIFKKADTSLRMRYINKRVDGLFVISEYLSKFYRKQNVLKIYPLMDFAVPRNQRIVLKKQFTFGYAGVAGRKKDDLLGFLRYIQEQKITNFNLLLIGDIGDSTLKKIDSLECMYSFLGRLPHDQTINELNKCWCQIVFRKSTRMNNAGFPTKFSESLCLGLPVVCNGFSDLNLFESNMILNVDKDNSTIQSFLNRLPLNKNFDQKVANYFYADYYFEEFKKFIFELLNKRTK